MAETIKTVQIVAPEVPGGYIVINETDYDSETMEIYGSEKKGKKKG